MVCHTKKYVAEYAHYLYPKRNMKTWLIISKHDAAELLLLFFLHCSVAGVQWKYIHCKSNCKSNPYPSPLQYLYLVLFFYITVVRSRTAFNIINTSCSCQSCVTRDACACIGTGVYFCLQSSMWNARIHIIIAWTLYSNRIQLILFTCKLIKN